VNVRRKKCVLYDAEAKRRRHVKAHEVDVVIGKHRCRKVLDYRPVNESIIFENDGLVVSGMREPLP